MIKNERQKLILEMLHNNKFLTPSEISDRLYTSYSSIRRDLEELEHSGLIRRSYGRVELSNNNPMLITYPLRIEKNSEQKRTIAKKAASLIQAGDTIFVDSSSSCSYFVKEIVNIKGLTIVTNNVEVLFFLTQHNINAICSGGAQNTINRYALTGSEAENTFNSIHADWCAFSTRSLTSDGKLYDIHYDETMLRNVMLKNSSKKIFLCDHTKINTISTYYQCSLSDIDYISCDATIPKEYLKKYPNLISI